MKPQIHYNIPVDNSKPEQVDLPVEAPSTNAEEMMVKPICKRNCIDTERIIMGKKLTDTEINHAQKLLKSQFPKLNGLFIKERFMFKLQLTGYKLFIVIRGIIGSLQQPLVVMKQWYSYTILCR